MPNLGIYVVYSRAELDFVTFMITLRFANQEGVLVSRFDCQLRRLNVH